MKKGLSTTDVLTYLILIIVSIICIFPLFWQFSSSFKSLDDLMMNTSSFFPKEWTLKNYTTVIERVKLLEFMKNSVLVSLASTIISISVACMASYAIARSNRRTRKNVTRWLITVYMFPPILLAIPYYITLSSIRLNNTLIGLSIVYLSFSLPYCIWMMTGYMMGIPLEIEEAAFIDGASRCKTFMRVTIPLAAPGIVATAIFAFINAWNEFLYSLVLISSGSKKTVSVALQSITNSETIRYNEMMAASILIVVPAMILFFSIQKWLAGGLTKGAIK